MQRNQQPPAPVPARVTQPTVSLLNGFKYTPSHSTDLRESFRRIKEAQEATQ